MTYFRELATNWRPLVGALIGLGAGMYVVNYAMTIMGPHLIEEFGWPRSEFAAITGLTIFMVFTFPIIGRLTDMIGVRPTALIGVILLPLSFLAFSVMNGDMKIYIAIFMVQILFGITTSATVYSRVVVQYIEKARGLALALVASGPAITGAVFAPMLNNFVEAEGWRAGYVALALFTAIGGVIALVLLPPERKEKPIKSGNQLAAAKRDYADITATRAFWLILGALFLCNVHQVLLLSQLTIMLLENGIPTAEASVMISAFASGMLVGRFACGVAIDRFPTRIVAALALGAPCVGLFVIASALDAPIVLTAAVLLLGLSFGAEGDLIGYIVAEYFPVRIYSSVMGIMTAGIATASSLGALSLSATLATTDSFVLFLTVAGTLVAVGGVLFLFLPKPVAKEEQVETIEPKPAVLFPEGAALPEDEADPTASPKA